MDSKANSHLVVLIHGLWGNVSHMQYLENSLKKEYPDVELLVSHSNEGTRTYDGIDVCGERVVSEIEQRAASSNITKISVIGYSLGGLIGRYAIAVLYDKGFFEHITPVNFTTFATPHLGARAVSGGFWGSTVNTLGPRLLSASGKQIFVVDKFRDTGKPLLLVMTGGSFAKALSLFKQRSLYANIQNDRSAVYYTTAISLSDPYHKFDRIKVNPLEEYSPILNPDKPYELLEAPRIIAASPKSYRRIFFFMMFPFFTSSFLVYSLYESFKSQARMIAHMKTPLHFQFSTTKMIEESPASQYDEVDETGDLPLIPEQIEMVKNLNSLKWKKHLVYMSKTMWTHAAIVVRKDNEEFAEGKIVVKHWLRNEFIV